MTEIAGIVHNNCLLSFKRDLGLQRALKLVYITTATWLFLLTPITIYLNALSVYTFYKKNKLKNAYNILLCSQAVVNIISALFNMPLYSTGNILRIFLFNKCGIYFVVSTTTMVCASLTFVIAFLITLDRYLIIFYPFRYQERSIDLNFLSKILLATVTATVAISLISIIMPGLLLGKVLTIISITLFVPFSIYTHVRAYLVARRACREIRNQEINVRNQETEGTNRKTVVRKVTKGARKTAIILTATMICYLPQIIILIIRSVLPKSTFINGAWVFSLTLSISYSFFSPFVYSSQIGWFRKSMVQLITCRTPSQTEEIDKFSHSSVQKTSSTDY